MTVVKISSLLDHVESKHLVYNCRTKEYFNADSMEEARALAVEHDEESLALWSVPDVAVIDENLAAWEDATPDPIEHDYKKAKRIYCNEGP